MPNPTKDDQREIARRGFSEGRSSRVEGIPFFMKKKTPQNRGKTGERSGDQSGRPKKDIASEIAQRVFEENTDAIYRAMLKALLKGDPKVFVVLADRAFGKLTLKAWAERESWRAANRLIMGTFYPRSRWQTEAS